MNNDNMYQSMLYGMGAQNVLGNLASLVSGGRIQAPPPPDMYKMMNMKMAMDESKEAKEQEAKRNMALQALPGKTPAELAAIEAGYGGEVLKHRLTPQEEEEKKLPKPIAGGAFSQMPDGSIVPNEAIQEWNKQIIGLRRPQTNVNVDLGEKGPKFGTIPPGHMLKKNPDGSYVMEAVAGSPAALEIEAEEKKAESRAGMEEKYSSIVLDEINRARELVNSDSIIPNTSWGGLLAAVPGSPQKALGNLLTTIKSNAGFERLQEIRDNSPTGGSLGPVSDFENKQLQMTIGALEQTGRKEDILYNLNRIEVLHRRVMFGTPEERKAAGLPPMAGLELPEFREPGRSGASGDWGGGAGEQAPPSEMSDEDLLKALGQ